MNLDTGRIRGAFSAAYEAQVSPPQDTAFVRRLEHLTGVDRSPGFGVEVKVADGKARTIAFHGAAEEASLLTTPNPQVLGVSPGYFGGFYVVDVATGDVRELIKVMMIECAASDVSGGRLFLATCIHVTAYDGTNILWTSRRVSLDGIKDLTFVDGQVRGLATELGRENVPFTIDPATGVATGGYSDF